MMKINKKDTRKNKKIKPVILEHFKCLVCSNKFVLSKDIWDKFNSDLTSGKHMDDVQHINCPKCNASQVQHLTLNADNEKKSPIQIPKENIDEMTSKLGNILGTIMIPFIYLLKENTLPLIISCFEFITFITSIIILQNVFHIDFIYSAGAIFIYKTLNTFRKRQ